MTSLHPLYDSAAPENATSPATRSRASTLGTTSRFSMRKLKDMVTMSPNPIEPEIGAPKYLRPSASLLSLRSRFNTDNQMSPPGSPKKAQASHRTSLSMLLMSPNPTLEKCVHETIDADSTSTSPRPHTRIPTLSNGVPICPFPKQVAPYPLCYNSVMLQWYVTLQPRRRSRVLNSMKRNPGV